MKTSYYALIAVLTTCVACNGGNVDPEQTPVKVKTCQAVTSRTGATLSFSGTVEEKIGVAVGFPAGGTIRSINVVVGQHVSAGQLLATVDQTSASSSHEAAKAMLKQARDAYTRMKTLYDSGSLPEIQWVETQSKLQQAESMERIARKSLDDCSVYSPIAGVVSVKELEVGQQAAPGMPVVKVIDIDNVNVRISVPEAEIAGVKIGQKAEIRVAALNNKLFQGYVAEKGVSADPLSHAYEVKILVRNPASELMPGMVANAIIANDVTCDATITLPVNAVQLDERNNTFVWVADSCYAKRRVVVCGSPTAQGGVTIISGLNQDDEVLIEGQQKVSENTVIEIIR